MKLYHYLFIFLFASCVNSSSAQKEKLVLPAKFLEYKLQQVNLSEKQWGQFYDLSRNLKTNMIKTKKEGGISKELMKRRDSVMKILRKDNTIPVSKRQAVIYKRLNLSEKQINGFEANEKIKAEYKKEVSNILTKKQQIKLAKSKSKPKTKKTKH